MVPMFGRSTIAVHASAGSMLVKVQVRVCQPATTGSFAETSPEFAVFPVVSSLIFIGMPAVGEYTRADKVLRVAVKGIAATSMTASA